MAKKIQLQIADPCHEDWDSMTQAEKGRFCGSCQKQVIDFTNMSDSQLAAIFKKSKGESVCGRFYGDQLDRTIEIPKKRIPWVKYFFQFALPAFLLSMKATAQAKVKTRPVTTTTSVADCNRVLGMVAPVEKRIVVGATKFTRPQKQNDLAVFQEMEKINTLTVSDLTSVKGIVSDENNDPIPFASVMIKGTKIGVAANSAGVFKIEIPLGQKDIMLQVSSVGYEAKEISINNETDLAKDLLIRLNAQLMGEVVVVAYTTVMGKTVVGGVTSTKKEKVKTIVSKEAEKEPSNGSIRRSLSDVTATIKIYPNPVQRNNVFNLDLENRQDESMQLTIVSLNGSVVFLQSQKINKGLNNLSVTVDDKCSAGIYFIHLINQKGKVIRREKLIVE